MYVKVWYFYECTEFLWLFMTFQFSKIGFLIQNEFQYEPEAENCKSREYNLGKLSFQSKLVSKEIQ